MTAAQAGIPVATALFDSERQLGVRWLSSVTCIDGPARNARRTSFNWSGYVVPNTPSPNYAQAEWRVRSVKTTAAASDEAIWPGLGGNGNTQLIQDGTDDQASNNGTRNHYFWIELVPQQNEQLITNLTPCVGDDVITAVSWAAGVAHFTLCDNTQRTPSVGVGTIVSDGSAVPGCCRPRQSRCQPGRRHQPGRFTAVISRAAACLVGEGRGRRRRRRYETS